MEVNYLDLDGEGYMGSMQWQLGVKLSGCRGGFELRNQIRHCMTVCIKRNLYLINYNRMRTQWTTKGNRDAGSSCSCDRGLHRYLRDFGGGRGSTPHSNHLTRYATDGGWSDRWQFYDNSSSNYITSSQDTAIYSILHWNIPDPVSQTTNPVKKKFYFPGSFFSSYAHPHNKNCDFWHFNSTHNAYSIYFYFVFNQMTAFQAETCSWK